MITIDQMKHEEIIALTHKDIEKMIAYTCAVEGIKLFPEPKVIETKKYEPDRDVFCLDDIYCKGRAPLDRIAEAFSKEANYLKKAEYNWNVGSEFKHLEPLCEYTLRKFTEVKPVKIFSKEYKDSIETELRKQKELKEIYDKDKAEYEKFKKEREDTTNWIWEKYHEEQRIAHDNENILERFKEYISLAEGCQNTAYKFLTKAYFINSHEENYIAAWRRENEPVEPVEAES